MAVEATQQKQLKKHTDALYERYGNPLVARRSGEYVITAPNGWLVLGHSMLEIVEKAVRELEPGTDIFRVDTKAVGKWR